MRLKELDYPSPVSLKTGRIQIDGKILFAALYDSVLYLMYDSPLKASEVKRYSGCFLVDYNIVLVCQKGFGIVLESV